VPRIDHDPKYPVTGNWPHLRDELLQRVLAQDRPPVHLVGHSLGGCLSLMAACRRPALVKSVVLIDSPVIGGWRAHSVHAMKLGGLMQRWSPGRVSQRRRRQWASVDAAHAHFAAKHAFARRLRRPLLCSACWADQRPGRSSNRPSRTAVPPGLRLRTPGITSTVSS
jgi:pimeloyl-ACP methyl ester carboxylesterase